MSSRANPSCFRFAGGAVQGRNSSREDDARVCWAKVELPPLATDAEPDSGPARRAAVCRVSAARVTLSPSLRPGPPAAGLDAGRRPAGMRRWA